MNQKKCLGTRAKKSKDTVMPSLASMLTILPFYYQLYFPTALLQNNLDTHCKPHIRVKKPFYVKAAQPSNYESTWANLTGL